MIHRIHRASLSEINRVLELIQRNSGVVAPTQTPQTGTAAPGGGFSVSGGGGTTGATGPKGDTGDPGPSGTADLSLILVSLTEREEIITSSDEPISDESGFLVTEIHVDWEIVTDDNGLILTAE